MRMDAANHHPPTPTYTLYQYLGLLSPFPPSGPPCQSCTFHWLLLYLVVTDRSNYHGARLVISLLTIMVSWQSPAPCSCRVYFTHKFVSNLSIIIPSINRQNLSLCFNLNQSQHPSLFVYNGFYACIDLCSVPLFVIIVIMSFE